jgi:uncharacterized membrane protein YgcG
MFETKNLLMLVILSGGILTGLTGTMIQAAPVYADTEDCEDNDDDNCNTTKERAQEIIQENNCFVDEDGRGGDGGAGGSTGDGSGPGGFGGAGSSANNDDDNRFICTNNLAEPNTGNDAFNSLP